jgi:hypothetical protein
MLSNIDFGRYFHTKKYEKGLSTGGDKIADWGGSKGGWGGHVPPSLYVKRGPDTEPDHSWVRDCSKYRKDPLKPPSLVEQHEEWVRFIREENNFNRLLKEEEDDYCEACEDENQSDSSDGEWFELQPIIRPIRTWEAQTVKRIRKRKPKKLTLWERRVKREIPGFTPLRA